jgi:Asp-tRNA(Asn)/Glu-tRNA(Gln) amidotransferase A subunit family amidase
MGPEGHSRDEGYKTSWGSALYRDQTFDHDATVVERLERAGAVLVAKLSTGELAYDDVWSDGKQEYQTRNPWDPSEGSSGSSAGPASATAAGLVGFAMGTESGGSILHPASRCGATGLRPTFGRVSRHGVMAVAGSLDKVAVSAGRSKTALWCSTRFTGPTAKI